MIYPLTGLHAKNQVLVLHILAFLPPEGEEERHDLENVFGHHSWTPAAELLKFANHMLIHGLVRTTLMGGEGDG